MGLIYNIWSHIYIYIIYLIYNIWVGERTRSKVGPGPALALLEALVALAAALG